MAKTAPQCCAILLVAAIHFTLLHAASADCPWYPYDETNWTTCVDKASSVCGNGTEQSPIDFTFCEQPEFMPTIDLTQWQTQDITVTNNGHTVEVSTTPALSTTVDMVEATLAQCHFHWGSEHTVDGTQYPLCVHCVHAKVDQTEARKYIVVGRFYSVGSVDNPVFSQFEDYPAVNGNVNKSSVSLVALFDGADMTNYWAYNGSLTTPGCSEIVDWKFLMSVGEVSQAQLGKLQQAVDEFATIGNFRPPQPLNGRMVDGCLTYCPWYPYSAYNWSTCAQKYDVVCSTGTEQSPIDFDSCHIPATMPMIDLAQWQSQDVTVKNNGHTIEVATATAMNTTVGSVQATLAQCHFHWMSEHTVDGSARPLCVHCVHAKVDQNQARPYMVVGRFYSVGTVTNQIFAKFEDYPGMFDAEVTRTSVALADLFAGADMTQYWAYEGSLTTPGCDEAVDWKFLMSEGELSQAQLTSLQQSMGDELATIGNFRPPQPLNGRVVDGCLYSDYCPWYPYSAFNWSNCVKNYHAACSEGMEQSPIDFESCSSALDMPEIDLQQWQPQDVIVKNNGHTIEVATATDMNTTVGKVEATLAQCHFHWTSEHTVDGYAYPLCVHCVHEKVDQNQARPYIVVGRFYSVGSATNPIFAQLEDYPGLSQADVTQTGVSLAELFAGADMTHYWAYEGSLTTPACSQVVDWKFLMSAGELSQAQLTTLQQSMGDELATIGNFRPPQPLNGRMVDGCSTYCPWYPYSAYNWSTCTKNMAPVCSEGKEQSPIDFDSCPTPATMPLIDLQQWQTQDVIIKNNGHTIEVKPATGMSTTVGEVQATLAQCHFHWTSEHTVDGKAYPLCVHCVHAKDDQTQARPYMVVGRFYSVGTVVNQIFTKFGAYPEMFDAHVTRTSVALADLFAGADMTEYWAYEGSLTTPACDEAVDWKFLMSEGELTQAQLTSLQQSMGEELAMIGNFRPPQALNGRVVAGCSYCPWYPYSASNWSTCVKDYSKVCSDGLEQSPIDFDSCSTAVAMPKIDLGQWQTQDVTVKNNGHTIEVSTMPVLSTTVGTVQATLAQCHFHWTSEHTVDGNAYDLCVHCVHKKVDQNQARPYVVVGRFYSAGVAANPLFAKLEDYPAVSTAGVTQTNVALVDLFAGADMTKYWAYEGSLTTPGCSEVVDWKFLMSVGELSEAQLTSLQQSMGDELATIGNFRPPQPLNARTVDGCPTYCPWYPYSTDNWSTCAKGSSAVCKEGTEQSPIDFDSCSTPLTMPKIDLDQWQTQDVTIKNNGHTIEVATTSPMNTSVGDVLATLAQCHFHWKSEHTVDGSAYELCVHCVHEKVDQSQARPYIVVGRFYELGRTKEIFASLEDYPRMHSMAVTRTDVSLVKLFDGVDLTQYWAYEGSLTTPGCDEAVDWKFLMNVGELSQAQLTKLQQSMGAELAVIGNFRATQPLNNRMVDGCFTYCQWYPYSASNWSTCAKGWSPVCSNGDEQSPINFDVCSNPLTMTEIDLQDWQRQVALVKNNGHTIEVSAANDMTTTVGDVQATLAQCHFHWTSEHTVDGNAYDLCVHCVHEKVNQKKVNQSQARPYIVVGRFYSVGDAPNQIFADLEDYPEVSFPSVIRPNVALADLFAGADMTRYWAYEGSLTTPSCSEVVDWKFLMSVGGVSQAQLTSLQQSMGPLLATIGNFRPPQPLNGRVVDGCSPDASYAVRLELRSMFQFTLWTCVALFATRLL